MIKYLKPAIQNYKGVLKSSELINYKLSLIGFIYLVYSKYMDQIMCLLGINKYEFNQCNVVYFLKTHLRPEKIGLWSNKYIKT